jgi:hypothetical protein
MSCLRDNGSLCNFTGPEAFCEVDFTDDNLCDTQDGVSCFNYASGWYVTYDGMTVSKEEGSTGTYCYSNDGVTCQLG